jgi:hypothetical protein
MFVCCECCVLSGRDFVTSWSLVQTSPTDCGASLCVIKKPQELGGHEPRWVAAPQKKKCYLSVRFNAIYGALARLVQRAKDTMLLLSVICCWLIFWFSASMFESECRQLYLQNMQSVLFLEAYQSVLQNAN